MRRWGKSLRHPWTAADLCLERLGDSLLALLVLQALRRGDLDLRATTRAETGLVGGERPVVKKVDN